MGVPSNVRLRGSQFAPWVMEAGMLDATGVYLECFLALTINKPFWERLKLRVGVLLPTCTSPFAETTNRN